ncbi:MAG: GAF domain-containing protein, partial [Chloroflexi bacterium]|nr:GAF domain-containing protein [Chloroflexota bacterium]
MSERNSEQLERELESARAQLALQETEIARLRGELEDVRLGRAVRQLFIAAGTMDAVLPQEERPELLTLVVRMAAQLVSARSASLLVIDQTARQLVFEAATGSKADEILKFRVPLGYGIAGAVAATGEPMAIASPETNPQFAADIAQSVGHIPQSILCVPMRYADQIIGVLEALDREDGEPFTSGDIEALAQYAGIAAQMVEYVHRSDYLRAALV